MGSIYITMEDRNLRAARDAWGVAWIKNHGFEGRRPSGIGTFPTHKRFTRRRDVPKMGGCDFQMTLKHKERLESQRGREHGCRKA